LHEVKREISNSAFKITFNNKTLLAQFLNNFMSDKFPEEVRAIDIEDAPNDFTMLQGPDQEGDAVKRINIPGKTPLFIFALVEHQSGVDSVLAIRVMQYMVHIWSAYIKQYKEDQKKDSLPSNFKLPMVLPIVYYGQGIWTARTEFADMIEGLDQMPEVMKEYVPKFRYEVLDQRVLTKEALESHPDMISLILMIDRLRDDKELEAIAGNRAFVDGVLNSSSTDILSSGADVIGWLMRKAKVSEEAIQAFQELLIRKEGEGMFNALIESILAKSEQSKMEGVVEGRLEGRLDLCRTQYLSGILTEEAALLTLKLMELSEEDAAEYLTIWKKELPQAGDTPDPY
jgi:hypothetical protein